MAKKAKQLVVTVERVKSDNDSTLSIVSIDGKFECFGLEDEFREDKVPGETRIPAGEYPLNVRKVGGFHNRYSEKFPDMHKGMLQVMDVPDFEYILIHIGNTEENTDGCLLLGQSGMSGKLPMEVLSSTQAYKAFYPKVIAAAEKGNAIIRYIDSDGLGTDKEESEG